ncbi:MAG: peptidoglycan bridge formation glycyltransferase FemA/FemB family protein, partial [bacterium]|nr:peptidoglycan bridge formation glycyltransferase FemA/FemB family protein [bacterium]
LEYLREIGKKNNCLFIKLEPDLTINNPQLTISNCLKKSKPVLPVHTFLLDLTQTEESILKKMHEKTRYNLRLAQKQGVEVKEKDDEKSLEIFLDFLIETEKRQGFYSHPKSYFRRQWEVLKPAGMIHLLLAYFDNKPISGILLLRFKDSLSYAYGGSSEIHREKMPNHLLHWEAIKLGKKLGCKVYDFWGSYLKKPEPSDPWYGIYRFKAGFGGEPVSYLGAYDFVISPFLCQIYMLVDFTRWLIFKLKRRIQF